MPTVTTECPLRTVDDVDVDGRRALVALELLEGRRLPGLDAVRAR